MLVSVTAGRKDYVNIQIVSNKCNPSETFTIYLILLWNGAVRPLRISVTCQHCQLEPAGCGCRATGVAGPSRVKCVNSSQSALSGLCYWESSNASNSDKS